MKKVLLIILPILLIGIFYSYTFTSKNSSPEVDQISTVKSEVEISTALDVVKSAYQAKMNLIEELLEEKAFSDSVSRDLRNKLDFIKKFELKTQYEIDQFDYLQKDLSRRVNDVFSDKRSSEKPLINLKKSSENYEEIKKRIVQARMSYNDKVQIFNSGKDIEKMPNSQNFPIFKNISSE